MKNFIQGALFIAFLIAAMFVGGAETKQAMFGSSLALFAIILLMWKADMFDLNSVTRNK